MAKQWIVVADHARARIYEAAGEGKLKAVASFENQGAHGHARDLASDRPGRRGDSFGHRHALGSEEDPKRHAAAQFAHEIGQYLDAARRGAKFEALTLAMPPHFLGLLRKSLDAECARRVERTLKSDLMHLSEAELRAHLGEALKAGG